MEIDLDFIKSYMNLVESVAECGALSIALQNILIKNDIISKEEILEEMKKARNIFREKMGCNNG